MKSLLPMVLVTSAPLPAQTAPQTPAAAAPQPDPNSELAARVKNALEAASAEVAQGVDVMAANGVVSLFGTVPDRPALPKNPPARCRA